MSRPVLIVMPARNEAANLPPLVAELRRERPDDVLLLVDDASSDGTGHVARRLGLRVLGLRVRLGYGGAVQAGLKHALRHGFGVAVSFDADGQHAAADVGPLVEAVAAGSDLAIGSRFLARAAHHGPWQRRTGRRLFAAMVRALTGLRLSDPTSGLKAFGPRAMELFATARFPDRFPDADALVLASRARLVIAERPAAMRPSWNRHSMHDGYRAIAYSFNMLLSLLAAASGHERDLRG